MGIAFKAKGPEGFVQHGITLIVSVRGMKLLDGGTQKCTLFLSTMHCTLENKLSNEYGLLREGKNQVDLIGSKINLLCEPDASG